MSGWNEDLTRSEIFSFFLPDHHHLYAYSFLSLSLSLSAHSSLSFSLSLPAEEVLHFLE